jgi:hypothetical protein
VVASFVLLSPALCVAPAVPFGRVGVPDKFAAVPVILELIFATCVTAPPFSETVSFPFVSNAACDVPAAAVIATPGTGPLTAHGPVPIICPPTVTFPVKLALVPLTGPVKIDVPLKVGELAVKIWLGVPPFADT